MSIRFGLPRSKNQWILLLLGLFAGAGSALPLAQGVLSSSWRTVDGVITDSRHKPGFRTMGVDIRYRYTVDGHEYTGGRYRFQAWTTSVRMRGRDIDSILGRYPVGEKVQVAVNHLDHTNSVLEPGPDFDSLIPLVLGLFLLVLALGQPANAAPRPAPIRPRYGLANALAVAGLGLLVLGSVYIYGGIYSNSWPSVEGRIVYSHARTGRNPETLLWYEYSVDGQQFKASNYRTGGNVTPFASVAEEAAKRYPVGRAVPVYYNPRNPQEALLEPGLWWGNFVAPALGIFLLFAAWIARKYAEIMHSRRINAPSPRSAAPARESL